MRSTITKQYILAGAAAGAWLLLPLVVQAHGGIDDGDMHAEAGGHSSGASELLNPKDPRWWYLLAVSLTLMGILSRMVWKYLQVEEPKKTSDVKPEEKK